MTQHRRAAFLLVAVLAARPAWPQETKLEPAVDAVAKKALEDRTTPGVSVAILVKGQIVLAKGYGFANLEDGIPVDAKTVFRIGSVTKQFAAASVMKLVEEGKLAVDDLAKDRIPEFDFQGKTVTIAHLLHHTSGIPNYTDLGPEWMKTIRNDYTPVELVNVLVRGKKYDFEPGTKWAYDNTGYVLLGIAIEDATKMGYYDFLAKEILAGKGLDSIEFGSDEKVVPHRAQGYVAAANEKAGWTNDATISMTHPYAAGALIANASDLVRWTWLLSHGKIVSEKSYEYMKTSGKLNDGKLTHYGCGLAETSFEGEPRIAHNGGINGFMSSLAYYPKSETAIAVLVNSESGDPDALESKFARIALGKKEVELKDLPIDDDELDRVTGRYEGALKVIVRRKGDQLFLQAEGQGELRLLNQGDGVFRAKEAGVVVNFAKDGDEAKEVRITQSGIEMVLERAKN